MSQTGSTSEDGFTLVEALVAFVIVAMVLQMAFQIVTVQMRNVEFSQAQRGAIRAAENVLESIGPEIKAQPGLITGKTDDLYDYEIVFQPYQLQEHDDIEASGDLLAVDLTVAWQAPVGPGAISIDTLIFGAPGDD